MPTIKGTFSATDDHAMKKLLKTTKFPSNFSSDITLNKINIPVMSQWVERKITELLGFEDEIVASTAINLFLPTTDPAFDVAAPTVPPKIDPKRAQLDLVGFLGEEDAASFCQELWTLLLDAQETPTGIPRKLLEETKKQMSSSRQQRQTERRHERPRNQTGIRNPMVREASRRAQEARQALGAPPPRDASRQDHRRPPPVAARRNPVPVSPPHEQQPPYDPRPPFAASRHYNDSYGRMNRNDYYDPRYGTPPPARGHDQSHSSSRHRERDSRRRRDASESSSRSSSSYDSEEEEDRRRRRSERRDRDEDRRRRYDDRDDDRRRRDDYNRQQDEYGRRSRYRDDDEEEEDRRYRDERDRYREERRDRHHRRRDRSRSYDRSDRRRRHRRSRSYSDSS